MSEYAKFLGLYHVEGRMIPAPELLVNGAMNGLRVLPAKKTTSSESIFFSSNIIEKHEFWKGIWEGAYLLALKKYFFRSTNVWHRLCFLWRADHRAAFGMVIRYSKLQFFLGVVTFVLVLISVGVSLRLRSGGRHCWLLPLVQVLPFVCSSASFCRIWRIIIILLVVWFLMSLRMVALD